MWCSVVLAAAVTLGGLDGAETFLAGSEAQRNGNHAEAARLFEAAGSAGTALTPYALLRIAKSRQATGDASGAAELCRQVLEHFPKGPWRGLAQARLAEIYEGEAALDAAVPLREAHLATPVLPWWMQPMAWNHSEALLKLPNKQEAGYAYFRKVIQESIYPAERLNAAKRLKDSTNAEDRAYALMGMIRSGAYADAAKSLLTSPTMMVGVSGEAIALTDLAELLSPTSDTNRAEALERVVRENADSLWMRLWLVHIVRAQAETGHLDRALRAADLLVELYPDEREAGDTMWWLAKRVESEQGYSAAVPLFERLVTGCPKHFRADDTLLYMAEEELEQGRRGAAASTLIRLGDTFDDSRLRDYAYYQAALLALRGGSREDAAAAFEKAANVGAGKFYAHRALDRLGKDGGRNLRIDGARPVLQVMPALTGEPPTPPTLFTESAQYERLQFFGRYGLEEGEWEALDLLRKLSADPAQEMFYQSIAEAGFAHSALEFAAHHGWGVDGGRRSLPRQRLELPRAYWGDVVALGREVNIDPYLILAVAKQESTYRATVQSHAGATGVMQLMPSTARWLVGRRGWHPAEALRQPQVPRQ